MLIVNNKCLTMSVYIYAVNRASKLSSCILNNIFFSTKTKFKESGLIANKMRSFKLEKILEIFSYILNLFSFLNAMRNKLIWRCSVNVVELLIPDLGKTAVYTCFAWSRLSDVILEPGISCKSADSTTESTSATSQPSASAKSVACVSSKTRWIKVPICIGANSVSTWEILMRRCVNHL